MTQEADDFALPTDEQGVLSHLVNVARLPSKGLTVNIDPSADVLSALAAQCEIESISSFSAQITVKAWHKDGVRVRGKLKASLEQSCIVTLEAVPETIDADIDAVFVPVTSKLAKPNINAETKELIVEAEGDDVPELYDPPNLDIGAVVTEFFVLELDPYPKSPNADEVSATFSDNQSDPDIEAAENPFAALANIRDKL